MVTLTVVGELQDLGTVGGEADTGDVMEYTFTVGNTGSVTLTDIGESKLSSSWHCVEVFFPHCISRGGVPITIGKLTCCVGELPRSCMRTPQSRNRFLESGDNVGLKHFVT